MTVLMDPRVDEAKYYDQIINFSNSCFYQEKINNKNK